MSNKINRNTILDYNDNTKSNNKPKKKKQNRIQNWTEYNQGLVKRGDITLLVSPAVFLPPKNTKKVGRKQEYSDALIQFLIELREILQTPFRQTIGLARTLAIMQGVKLPSYNRLCVRMQELKIEQKLDHRRFKKPICLLVDSTGLKTKGEGEWKVRKHGIGYRRGWKKLHITVDYTTQLITAHMSTTETVVDQDALPNLIDTTLEQGISIEQIIGDGAYSSHSLYTEVEKERGVRLLSPPRKNAKLHVKFAKTHPGRGGSGGKYAEFVDKEGWETYNEYLRGCLHLGFDEWKNQIGYHKRSIAETAMGRLKSAFSDRLKSKSNHNQTTEIAIRIRLLNLWTAQNQHNYKATTT